MTVVNIPTPGNNISKKPDKYTKKSPDMTADHAESRIFFFNCKFLKFGTDDKVYAAAIILSCALLGSLLLVCVMLAISGNQDLKHIAVLLVSAFTGTSGYAFGRASSSINKEPADD
ncbi:MAG: hypothetical protein J0L77_07115 [Alphaproteobacteria bacterium]|nr:hypothetical protein [Alphaproteobacteria bacterium]